ncbi:heavy-metal-associated domain-containing protein [Nitratireductor luteus]|uniref:heavy-metal-associated domain-containing protein n=1 Tax=Nitratireductor luteus TaxID=2976980 RepID=UPI00237C7574|nr:heavy metal-associated domain-containing protein [Nitratireductor luteus]
MPKAIFAALALGTSAMIALPLVTSASAQSTSKAVAVAEMTQTFAIDNMTCASCPITVRLAMEGVAGVKSVKVDFEAKSATVLYDPSATTVAAIAAASTNAGYPAKAIGN